MGSPNNFKSRRATHQNVLSGGTKRPTVEEAAFLSHGASYNLLVSCQSSIANRAALSHPSVLIIGNSVSSIAALPRPSLRSAEV